MFYPFGVERVVEAGRRAAVPATYAMATLSSAWGSAWAMIAITNLGFSVVILMGAAGYALTGALYLVARRLRPSASLTGPLAGPRFGEREWKGARARGSAAVSNSNDVGLNRVFDRVCRVSRRHRSFEPVSDRGIAVVAARTKNDGSLLLHGVVAVARVRTLVHRREATELGIAGLDRPIVGLAFERAGHIVKTERFVVGVDLLGSGGEHILDISHDPGPVAFTNRVCISGAAIPEVEGFHGPVAVVLAGGLGIPVVEAAFVVVVLTVHNHVHRLRLVASCRASGPVVAIADAPRYMNSVDCAATQSDRDPVRSCFFGIVPYPTSRGEGEIVVLR